MRILATTLVGSLLCSMALAQKVGLPAPEIEYEREDQRPADDPNLQIEELRGRIVLFFFLRAGNPESVEALPIVIKVVENFGGQGVVLIAATDEKKDKVEGTLKSNGFEGFIWYGDGVPTLYDVASYPYIFIIDPAGIVAWKGHPMDDLENRVRDQLRKTPPIGADEDALNEKLRRAEEYVAKNEFGRAETLAKFVMNVTDKNSGPHEKARGLHEKLLESAKARLDEARGLYRDRKYQESCDIVAEIHVHFTTKQKEGADRDLVIACDTDIGRLRGDINTKQMIGKTIDNFRGRLKNDEAAELERNSDFVGALRIYRKVLEDFPKLASGEAAKAAIDRLNADPKVQARMTKWREEQSAERMLQMAERYARVDMFDEAREQFQKIIDQFPRSPAATQAREAIKKLPAKGAASTTGGDKR